MYSKLFKPYTVKQWEREPKNLAPSVLARIPIRNNRDDRYFTDKYQGYPADGYTRIFDNLFMKNERISVKLNTNYHDYDVATDAGARIGTPQL